MSLHYLYNKRWTIWNLLIFTNQQMNNKYETLLFGVLGMQHKRQQQHRKSRRRHKYMLEYDCSKDVFVLSFSKNWFSSPNHNSLAIKFNDKLLCVLRTQFLPPASFLFGCCCCSRRIVQGKVNDKNERIMYFKRHTNWFIKIVECFLASEYKCHFIQLVSCISFHSRFEI